MERNRTIAIIFILYVSLIFTVDVNAESSVKLTDKDSVTISKYDTFDIFSMTGSYGNKNIDSTKWIVKQSPNVVEICHPELLDSVVYKKVKKNVWYSNRDVYYLRNKKLIVNLSPCHRAFSYDIYVYKKKIVEVKYLYFNFSDEKSQTECYRVCSEIMVKKKDVGFCFDVNEKRKLAVDESVPFVQIKHCVNNHLRKWWLGKFYKKVKYKLKYTPEGLVWLSSNGFKWKTHTTDKGIVYIKPRYKDF